jgi:hypothetical protein
MLDRLRSIHSPALLRSQLLTDQSGSRARNRQSTNNSSPIVSREGDYVLKYFLSRKWAKMLRLPMLSDLSFDHAGVAGTATNLIERVEFAARLTPIIVPLDAETRGLGRAFGTAPAERRGRKLVRSSA